MPPIAPTSMPTQIVTIATRRAKPFSTAAHDLVPAQVEISQIGNKNASRSGRKPLPMLRAAAPHSANCFSPFQQRQQQYAVSRENSARWGRSGPSSPDCQNTGFTSRRKAPAIPAQGENIRLPSRKATYRDRPLTSTEMKANVRSGLRNTTLTMVANATKNG